jgi:predicted acyltransferase
MAPSPAAEPKRLVSLDAFRGATIALMVLVNNAGSGQDSYRQLEHSPWHGWTITDTVFPGFLWIVGVAITLSLGNRIASGISKSQLLPQIFRRAAVLLSSDSPSMPSRTSIPARSACSASCSALRSATSPRP